MVHQSGLQGKERGPNTRQHGSSDHSYCKPALPFFNVLKSNKVLKSNSDHGAGAISGSALVSGKTCMSSIPNLRQTSALETLQTESRVIRYASVQSGHRGRILT